jgi:hypothetical protein
VRYLKVPESVLFFLMHWGPPEVLVIAIAVGLGTGLFLEPDIPSSLEKMTEKEGMQLIESLGTITKKLQAMNAELNKDEDVRHKSLVREMHEMSAPFVNDLNIHADPINLRPNQEQQVLTQVKQIRPGDSRYI